MKKGMTVFILVLAVSLSLSSCGGVSTYGSSSAQQGKTYTSMEETDILDDLGGSAVLGISPDGKNLVVANSEGIDVVNVKDHEIIESIETEEIRIGGKTALWSQSGDFILGDASYVGNELKMLQYMNFSTYSLKKTKGNQVTHENNKNSIMEGGVILYSPSWSADGKSMIYSEGSQDGIRIMKVDVKSEKESVLYQTDDRSGFEQGIELKNGLLLCEFNGSKRGDYDLFLYDTKKKDKESLKDILDKEDDQQVFYEIKGWSDDRRTVLINKLYFGQCIQKCIILSFNKSFNEYEVNEVEYQLRNQVGQMVIVNDKAENRIAYASMLSSDGRYLVTREDEVTDTKDDVIIESNRQLVLHDLVEDESYTLYETAEKEPFGVSSPLNRNCEALYMTDNGLLMVWFMDGYRIFQLEK